MNNVVVKYMPDLRESLCFPILATMDECFDKLRETCETFKDDLQMAEFVVETEDGDPMFNISGCIPQYFIKDNYKHLEPAISEIFNQYFVGTKVE